MNDTPIQKEPSAQVMVVDDDPSNRKLLSDMLSEHGYQVRPAASGRLALRSIAFETADLILMDIKMPDMDG